MTDPGLPLTTGEGNTAGSELRKQAREKFARARTEGGVLREAIVRGHGCCMVNDPDFDQAFWDEALAECGRLREQLDAARQTLEQIADQQPRTLANLRSHGVVFDGPLTADPDNWQDVAFTIYTDLCEVDSLARAVLGVEGPAE